MTWIHRRYWAAARHRLGGALIALTCFLAVSQSTRLLLTVATPAARQGGGSSLLGAFAWGGLYDLATASILGLPMALYLALLPGRWFASRLHRGVAHVFFFVFSSALLFIAVAEWLFWDEFGARFNFIAVDYLIYTREVLDNITESYPIPLLLGAIGVAAAALPLLLFRTGWVAAWHRSATPFRRRLLELGALFLAAGVSMAALDVRSAPDFGNHYLHELALNGPYSFVAAFRDNALSFERFYRTLPEDEALRRVRSSLEGAASAGAAPNPGMLRRIENPGPERRLNVVQITVESLSAKYLGTFGNRKGLTPNLDALAQKSLLFTRFYATGNRTVRGMEALTLSLPPTPGRSVVKRPDNGGLFSLGAIFQGRGYDTQFLYGGYGYFDNMNAFFSGNGYRVVDRAAVPAPEVTFANAWGAADEDLFRWSLTEADRAYAANEPFFQFVMTTSNHRPFTYPDGRIDIPSHTGRDGGIKYTDWAIGEYFRQAEKKEWFANTLFIVVADHCAGTSGRVELSPSRFRIPLMIYAPGWVRPGVVDKLSSQIDLAPTVLGLLGWSYDSRFFGMDMLRMKPQDERALIATHQALGLLTEGRLVVLRPRQEVAVYRHDPQTDELKAAPEDRALEEEAIALYEAAGYLLDHHLYMALAGAR